MNRRQMLTKLIQGSALIGAVSLGAKTLNPVFDGKIKNPCLAAALPKHLAEHELMHQALAGFDTHALWDCHFHLVGNGLKPSIDGRLSGIKLNPTMTRWTSPKQKLQHAFYMNASCIKEGVNADFEFVRRVHQLLAEIPAGMRFMLLAFDQHYNNDGSVNEAMSTFYVPNEYAARMADSHPQLEWIASVHPYREDAIEQLEWCAAKGAKAIKWLPPAMNIDPASNLCEPFYRKLIQLKLPLLTHAGEEKAVHGEALQMLANPLKLRLPLEMGVKVIVAHCASLGSSVDIESKQRHKRANFELFGRLMDTPEYQTNFFGDISAINLINRKTIEIKELLSRQDWHHRLLYASDYPLPGVMPIISVSNLYHNGLIENKMVSFLQQVRSYNAWLFDLLVKRLMCFDGNTFNVQVFETSRHFTSGC